MTPVTLEVCVDSVRSALIAQAGGAQRVELCQSLPEGGTTPSAALISKVRELLDIEVYVLIRPRGGDFLYDDIEFDIMLHDILYCARSGCDGVVIGMLQADGAIDKERCAELVHLAKQHNLGVSFHRAFDRCNDLQQGLEDIISLGCERVLTSGGQPTAQAGAAALKALVEQAAGRISIMPGSGLTPDNVAALLKTTGAKEVHGTFSTTCPGHMTYHNPAFPEADARYRHTDACQLKKLRD